jgi:endonuclease-3
MEKISDIKKRAGMIMAELDKLYTDADCTLEFGSPLQLLISTQLAAQCTDERVNIVTKTLYQKYKTASDFADADITELEEHIRPTGFFRNKAKNIINCCRKLITDYDGEVPHTMEELLKLPGVGRKTANLVLGDVFNVPGIVVDTHTGRLARRLGLTGATDPTKVEFALMKIIPEDRWTMLGHQLVLHGRAVCGSRKPVCAACSLAVLCPKEIL